MSLVFLTEAEECQLHAAPAIVASKPELVSMPMRGYQRQASDAVFKAWGGGNRYALIQLATGLGKCLGKGQTVLKHSGEIVTVESIRAGDLLMGPDSRPRTVVGVASGYGPMRRIVPVKGEEWRCNDVHVLTTVNSATGEVSDTPLDVFQTEKTRDFRRLAKQFSVKVDFPASEPLGISPYFLGIWLGDGDHSLRRGVHISKNDIEVEEACSAVAAQHGCVSRAVQGRTCKSYFIAGARVGGKRQPNGVMAMIRRYVGPGMEVSPAVLTASRAERLEFLAGLMDTDGHASAGCFDFVQKNRNIFDAVVFCARSVGLKVTTTTKTVPGYGLYYRCCISGDCAMVPTRIPRKRIAERKQIKDALRTGFSIAEDGYGEWFGFELDGDGRFLLGDFTVTHNTRVAGDICQRIKGRVLFLCQLEVLLQNALHALEGITGEWVGVERGPSRAGGERIIVGTVQTVSRRLRKFRRDSFEAIVVDELQHVRGEQYQRVLDWFQCPALGMTATPVDGMGFGYPVFSMSLAEGSREGWLAPVVGERVDIGKVDLRSVRREGEDFEAKSLDLEMVKGATGIADVILERHSKDKGIAFFPGRKSARLFADVINGKRPGMCVYIDAHIKGDDRAALMRKLATGEARWLSNVGIATEGFDWPEASVIAMCHPTTSKTLYMQKVGRGTRPCGVDLRDEVSAEHRRAQIDLSAKPCMRILDFLGASEGETLELASFDTMDFSVRPHVDIAGEQVMLPDKREDAERPETIARALPRRRGLSVKSSTKYSTWEFDPMYGSCSDELKEKIDAFESSGERGGTDAGRRV